VATASATLDTRLDAVVDDGRAWQSRRTLQLVPSVRFKAGRHRSGNNDWSSSFTVPSTHGDNGVNLPSGGKTPRVSTRDGSDKKNHRETYRPLGEATRRSIPRHDCNNLWRSRPPTAKIRCCPARSDGPTSATSLWFRAPSSAPPRGQRYASRPRSAGAALRSTRAATRGARPLLIGRRAPTARPLSVWFRQHLWAKIPPTPRRRRIYSTVAPATPPLSSHWCPSQGRRGPPILLTFPTSRPLSSRRWSRRAQ